MSYIKKDASSQKAVLKDTVKDDNICEPEKGWYKQDHVACINCAEHCRAVCKIFAVDKGLKTPSDVIRIPKGVS